MELSHNYVTAFIFSFLAAATFAALFQAPKKTLAVSGVIGAVGWVTFIYMRDETGYSSFYANFFATIAIAILSELAARIFKQPTTIYINPGIIPIVPGLGIYNGMTRIIEGNYDQGINILLNAGQDAAAIALAIMFIASFFRMMTISKEHRRVKQLLELRKNKIDRE